MSDRNILAEFLFNILGNYITHHLLTLVGLLAAWLTPRVRRAIRWLRGALAPAPRTDPWLRSIGSSKQTGSATLSGPPPPQGNVVMTPPSGALGIVGMPPGLPAGTAGALAMAAANPPPFPPAVALAANPHWFANNAWEAYAREHTHTAGHSALYTWARRAR